MIRFYHAASLLGSTHCVEAKRASTRGLSRHARPKKRQKKLLNFIIREKNPVDGPEFNGKNVTNLKIVQNAVRRSFLRSTKAPTTMRTGKRGMMDSLRLTTKARF
jgi:hypothetical protein